MSTSPIHRDRAATPDIHRTLPHHLEAEQGVLGSMLISPTDVLPMVEHQPAEIFYQPAHATIFVVLLECWKAQRPADAIILSNILRDRGQLDEVGGPAFVTHLFTFTPTAANAGYYLEIVREKYALRRVINTCTHYAAWAYEDMGEVELLQDALEAEVLHLPRAAQVETQGDDPHGPTMAALESLEAIYQGKRDAIGLTTGLAPLDRMLGGLRPSQLVLVAARPGVGKSALALNIAESVAVDRGLPVGMFSLEMTQAQQRTRLLLSRGMVDLQELRERVVGEEAFSHLSKAAKSVANAPLFIDDARGLTIADIRARARRWHQQHGLQLLVVDYLQLVHSTSHQARGSREREISEVSEGLKTLARELEIPVLALSQLSRDNVKASRPPRLEDLRESGSLEQDADAVLLLHRAELQAKDDDERAELSGEAELIVAKQREGPMGPIKLTFLKQFTRFEVRA